MKRLLWCCALLLAVRVAADANDFKGTWEGPLALDSHTVKLTLVIDEASKDAVRGRLLQNGDELAPISDGKLDGGRLTFRADTIDVQADRDGDRLLLTLAVPHGKTFHTTLTRKATAAHTDSAPPPRGALLLAGGGTNAPDITRRFTELAGGHDASIVVIPTADEEKRLTAERFESLRARIREIFGVREVTVLHTRDRTVAGSADFVKPLQHATGVWILGGETKYLVDAYVGTRVEREIRALFARGGVVGGTSAGALIQTSPLIAADGKKTIDGFGLLSNVLVWPHWSERRAENDLVKYTAEHPPLLGIGIDEATAIVVQGQTFEVIGEGTVGIVDGRLHDGKKYYRLARGDRYDLATRALVPEQSTAAFRRVMSSYGPAQFRGSVLVARDGKVLFRYANSSAATFRIGSLTKQFTAAAILLLEERGKLRTSDPMRRYLPESPREWDEVTIYHLLTHTSGIPSDQSARLSFKPGQEWTYSNEGYVLLGRIIERVSKQTYAQFVAENILAPLGMHDTGAVAELPGLGGAGSLQSTTDDLLKWEEALFGGKLLSAASFAKMTTPFRNGYGCALRLVVSKSGRHVYANEGRVPGWNASLQYYADDRLVIAVLADLDTQVDANVAQQLAAAALTL